MLTLMDRRIWLPALLGVALPAATMAQQAEPGMTLKRLAELAKVRAVAQQAAFQELLQPFLKDFELDYNSSQSFLDSRVTATAALGDGIVPWLLLRLTPSEESPAARNIAANSARVLAAMEPAGFVDGLLEILVKKHPVGRPHAVTLLGLTGAREAAIAIDQYLSEFGGDTLVRAVDALRQLKADIAVERLTRMLPAADRKLREALLRYFTAVKARSALPTVLTVFAAEARRESLPRYLEFFSAVARDDAAVADALAPLLLGSQLDRDLEFRVVRTLGRSAPQLHPAATAALRQLMQKESTSALGRTAGVALRDLGDKKALQTLLDLIHEALNRRKRDPQLLEARGDVLAEMGKLAEAIRDYEEAITQIRISVGVPQAAKTMQVSAYLKIIRCEVLRERWPRVVRVLRDSEIDYERFAREAADDEVLKLALEERSVKRHFETR